MFDDLPSALASEYTAAQINESIVLYEGEMEIIQNATVWGGNGVIRFEWLPYSRVAMSFHPAQANAHIELQPSKLRIRALDCDSDADVNLTRVPFVFPNPSTRLVEGRVRQINCGENIGLARLRFYIPNLPVWLGNPVRSKDGAGALKRLTLQYGEWDVVIDAIKFESQEHQELVDSGGHGLTHVGAVARRDGAPFSLEDSEPLLECISYFLSFCRGAWTCPILLSGEDRSGHAIGRRWVSVLVDRYKATVSWVPSTEPVGAVIQSVFRGYADAWFSAIWGDALRNITQWYVESSTGDVGKSIILMQAALELLAWIRLVEEKQILTKKDWKEGRISFSTKLRMLLSLSSIPHSIPSNLSDLTTYCNACQAADGPEGITSIRNALVHPSPPKRARLTTRPRAVGDAWLLASWYLDLCVLNACGYKGRYSNRTAPSKWAGEEVEAVPWS